MNQQLLEIREQTYTVRYAINDLTQSERATIGMTIWDKELAQAQIADRLGVHKEQVTIMGGRLVDHA